MRILLILIVALNLLYIGWEYLSPGVVSQVPSAMPGSLKTLELLHENDVLDKSSESVEGNDASLTQAENLLTGVGEAQAHGKLASCYTLGPFKDESIMLQLRESIAEYVTDISVRKRQQSIKHRYWVHVPAMPDRKQAKLMAKKLRKKKINDFYIVLSGSQKNSISLGHFRDPKHANRRMKQVNDLGVKAETDVIYREYDIYWLDYQVDSMNGKSDFSVEEYISDGVSQLVRDCQMGDDLDAK